MTTQTPLVPVETSRDHNALLRDLVQKQTDAFNRNAPDAEKVEILNQINKLKEEKARRDRVA